MAKLIICDSTQSNVEPNTKCPTYTTLNEIMVLLYPSYYANTELDENVWLPGRLMNFIGLVSKGKDPMFDPDDLAPFYMLNFF